MHSLFDRFKRIFTSPELLNPQIDSLLPQPLSLPQLTQLSDDFELVFNQRLQSQQALDSLIGKMKKKDLSRIQDKSRVLLLEMGGTKWKAQIGTFKAQTQEITYAKKHASRIFKDDDRSFESPYDFFEAIINLGLELVTDLADLPTVVGISYAFESQPTFTDHNLSATHRHNTIGKEWEVKGMRGVDVGRILVNVAHTKNFPLQTYAFLNDTVALALAKSASASIVAGTGTNTASLLACNHQEATYINQESGRLSLLPETPLIAQMKKDQGMPDSETILEYFTGGDYLRWQLEIIAGLVLGPRAAQEIDKQLKDSIVSDIARGTWPHMRQAPREHQQILVRAAEALLIRAGQIMAAKLAAIARMQGKKNLKVACEGSVINKGYKVQETLEATFLDLTSGKLTLIPARGKSGIGLYALYLDTFAR